MAAYRAAVADERTGPELQRVLAALEGEGFEVSGDRLKTAPRGYDREHPRIELLRHRQLFAGRSHGFAPVIHTPGLLEVVREDWRALRPLVAWIARLPG